MGKTTNNKTIVNNKNVYGSYIHGIFDKEEVSKTIIESLLKKKGKSLEELKTYDMNKYKNEQYDILAAEVRKALDMDKVYEIMNL